MNTYIKKEETNLIKGIALIMMFIHHLFTFPMWYVEGISYPELAHFAETFREPLRICVCIYAFLTGYTYFYSVKNFRYSIKKATDVWINYLVPLLLLLIPAILLGTYAFSVKGLLLEILVIKREILNFGWYILFYIVAILLMPLFAKCTEKSSIIAFGGAVIIPRIALDAFMLVMPQELEDFAQIPGYLVWLPVMASGFIFAKHELFLELENAFKLKSRVLNLIFCIIISILVMMARNCTVEYDFIYAPIFIFCLLSVLRDIRLNILSIMVSQLGKYSLQMWLISSVFFNCMCRYTQWFLYIPHNPVLVLIWGLAICYFGAYLVSIPINCIVRIKNSFRIFDIDKELE